MLTSFELIKVGVEGVLFISSIPASVMGAGIISQILKENFLDKHVKNENLKKLDFIINVPYYYY